jgi:hypothetical protein
VCELMAEDFMEEGVSVSGSVCGSSDVGGDADEAAVGVAPAEGAGESGGELDFGFGGEVRGVPGVEPAVYESPVLQVENELVWHRGKANTLSR